MPKATERYSASAWVRPFSFSQNNRMELQSRAGLSEECISRIERVIENERGTADALSGEPSATQVKAALQDGAAAAKKLSKWLTQVDAKTKSVIDNSNIQRTGKVLSNYKPAIRELILSIEIAKQKVPVIKLGRAPAKAIPRFLLRVASIIADEIELEGHDLDPTPNGPLCQTFAIALVALEIKRSKPSGIVKRMLDERGN